jgi:hypothetical protein
MKAVDSSETVAPTYEIARHHITQNRNRMITISLIDTHEADYILPVVLRRSGL